MNGYKITKVLPVSAFDRAAYAAIRKNVAGFLRRSARKYDRRGARILDIAPQVHEGAAAYFNKGTVATFDMQKGATYEGDITKRNSFLKSGLFHIVVCTEVLEHTLDPFGAVEEMRRLLKSSGTLLISVPLNFRIHGPLPDCWRFTEHGLRALLKEFKHVRITELRTQGRNLMPLHYTVEAQK